MLLDFLFLTVDFLFKNDLTQMQCAEALAVHGFFTKIKKSISKYVSNRQNPEILFECTYNYFSENFLDKELNNFLTLSQSYFRKWTF